MEDGRWVTMNGTHVFIKDGQSPMDAFIKQKGGKKDITVDLLTEKIYKIEDFKDLERDELIKIRDEVTEKINWLVTSEYYDSKKFKILSANEKKLNKLIFK